jgi:glycosyltransferase involved in cell wall biosynthesis
MTGAPPELSLIIPAYNEEARLPATLRRIAEYVRASNRPTEVIVVDDGSRDRTAEVARSFVSEIPSLRVVSNGVNRGKGFSVRRGALEARGRIVLFTDADLSAPIEEADKLLAALAGARADVAIGSRALDRRLIEVHESPFREFAGIIFNKIVRICLFLPFVDTQCGFKAFLREPCRILFEQQRIERFGFDPELLFLARSPRRRDSRALGAQSGYTRTHAPRQRADVSRTPADPLERPRQPLPDALKGVGVILRADTVGPKNQCWDVKLFEECILEEGSEGIPLQSW